MTFWSARSPGIPIHGIYKASMFGGSITAVLLNTPGAPPAVCTEVDLATPSPSRAAGKADS